MTARDIVFALSRHVYDSYDVFRDLVRLSGFEQCFVDEIDFSRRAHYIVTPINGEVPPALANKPKEGCAAQIIWWCLERFDGPGMRERHPSTIIDEAIGMGFDRCWTSCRKVQSLDPRLEHVVFGSHPDLLGVHHITSLGFDQYDFTHQSYAWGRREIIYRELRNAKLREGPSLWGGERSSVLIGSRLMLNAHQYDMQVYAPLRFALAAAFKLPIVTEWIDDPYPLTGHITVAKYEDLIETVKKVVALPEDEREQQGENLHNLLCHARTFGSEIRRSIGR